MCKSDARIGEESLLAGEFEECHLAKEIARSRIKQAFRCFPNRESRRGARKKKKD
jgi:hypothetical protein